MGSGGSAAGRMIRWLLAAVLVGAVGFGIYLWGKPATYTTTPHTRAVPAGPGARTPIPAGDIPGWHQVFADDFTGTSLDPSRWKVYSGRAGGDSAGIFDPRHVTVSNGMLVISAYPDPADGGRWASGGVSTSPGFAQTYGKYLVRFRLDAGYGIGHTLLLVPANGTWPPELDFSEDNGTSRERTLATLHYGPGDQRISRLAPINTARWHTLGVEWSPGLLRLTDDGRVWGTISGGGVPSVPMALAMQTQAWPCTGSWGRCPNAGTPPVVHMYVDWVVAYAPTSRR